MTEQQQQKQQAIGLLAARFKGQNHKNKLEKYEKTIIYFGCNYYVDSLR